MILTSGETLTYKAEGNSRLGPVLYFRRGTNLFFQEKAANTGRTGQLWSIQRNPKNLGVAVRNVPFAIQAAGLVFTGWSLAL